MSADLELSPMGARSVARRTAGGAALVSVALLAVNGLAYVFTVLAARTMLPQAYGELAALLGVLLIGAVPGTGLQTAAALRLAGSASGDRDLARLHAAALATTAVVVLGGVLAAGPVVVLLHLPGPAPVCWLVVVLLPQTLVGGYSGMLQGTGRFGRLALVTAGFGMGKVGGGTAGLLLGGSSAAALAGMAIGSLLAALLAWHVCGRPGIRSGMRAPVRAALRASGALLGLVVLVNLDLLLARHHLPPAQAGEYAVGAVFAKVAFWLPQGIAVVVLPALADPRARARALPWALALVGGSGAVLTAGTALLGRHALPLVGGDAYGTALGAGAWLFTALGGLLAVAQLLLYSGIAAARRLAAVTVWGTAVVECVAIELLDVVGRPTPLGIAGVATGCAALLVGAGLAGLRRAGRTSPGAPVIGRPG